MKVIAHFENIEQYEITVTTTATLAQWEMILKHVSKDYAEPMATFTETINRAIKKVKQSVLLDEVVL